MRILRRASAEQLDRLLADATVADLTYPDVGGTGRLELPAGYHHGCRSARVGHGDDAFARAVQGLREWRAHGGIGASVHPRDAALGEGNSLLVVLPAGPFRVVAPCRIVYVIDEPGRFGFAYGTLPGHPERGEESFVVERDEAGAVRFTVRAFSRPADLAMRLAGPAGRSLQRLGMRGYVRGLRRFVR